MKDDKKEQVMQLAGGMFGVCLEGLTTHDIPWEICALSAMLTAKMLGTMALDGGMPLPSLKCELADAEALKVRLRELLEEVLLVGTIAHRVGSPQELEAFVEQMEGADPRTTH